MELLFNALSDIKNIDQLLLSDEFRDLNALIALHIRFKNNKKG